MHTHDSYLSKKKASKLLTLIAIITLVMLNSCGTGGKDEKADTETAETLEDFHADNDIAMVIRSLADAIKVKEPLDSTDYDFNGILTDGQGAPLYTDVQGCPGTWVVDVIDSENAIIRNLYLGDLLPGDLEAYILQSLRLNESHRIPFTAHNAVRDSETQISAYDFGGGYLRFEIRAGMAPNGLEGPLMTIIISADLPAAAETQTNV